MIMQPPHFNSQVTQTYNVYVNPYGMRRLNQMFQPGCFDVLCARGKLAYDHEGNRRFRALVKQHQKQYSAATCKYEKSKIVSFIVSAVRSASPQGGFVKNIDGQWYEVGDRHAKEKVGQTFRDLLHTKYSSSTKAKARARMQKRINDEDEENSKDKAQTTAKKQNQPDAARSSSVSVVSDRSMDGNSSDASTVRKSNKVLPPLTSVTVKTETQSQTPLVHPGHKFLPHVSPSQSHRTQSSRVLGSQGFEPQQSFEPHPFLAPPMLHMPLPGDLEPLPLGASMKVDLHNASNNASHTEESFEDAMSGLFDNYSVAV